MMKRFFAIVLLAMLPALRPAHVQAQAVDTARSLLRPGDVVRLSIWREPELSGEFQVPESGVIVFPKIGERQMLGTPTAQIKEALRAEYLKYLRNPSIEVMFLRRVSVLGAVRNPGVFPLDETMTVANALALAGGTTAQGKPDAVQLLRDGQKLATKVTQKTMISELPLRSGDQLWVPERSWIERNTALVSTIVSAIGVAVAVYLSSNGSN